MNDRVTVNLPVRPFLYTLDQISAIFSVDVKHMRKAGYFFFVGRQSGTSSPDEIRVVNIARGISDAPDWRVEERELIRWMKRKGFRYVDR